MIATIGYVEGKSRLEATISCLGKESISLFPGERLKPAQLAKAFSERPGSQQERAVMSQLFATVPCNRHLIRRTADGEMGACLESDFPNQLVIAIAQSLGVSDGADAWCQYAGLSGIEVSCAFAAELGPKGARVRFYDMIADISDLKRKLQIMGELGLEKGRQEILTFAAETLYRGDPIVLNFEAGANGWAAKLEFPRPKPSSDFFAKLPLRARTALRTAERWGRVSNYGIRVSPWMQSETYSFYSDITALTRKRIMDGDTRMEFAS